MKELLMVMLLLMSFSVTAESELILKFTNTVERQNWKIWYLDRGGESASGFYVIDWTNDYFILESDKPRTSCGWINE